MGSMSPVTCPSLKEHGESLDRAFRFKAVGKAAKFNLRTAADVDFDGAQEIVGGLSYADAALRQHWPTILRDPLRGDGAVRSGYV